MTKTDIWIFPLWNANSGEGRGQRIRKWSKKKGGKRKGEGERGMKEGWGREEGSEKRLKISHSKSAHTTYRLQAGCFPRADC